MPPNILRRLPSSLKLLLTKNERPPPLSLLPEDILLETARHLPSVDLLSLALTNARFCGLFLPTLYSSVDLRCNAHCQYTLSFLLTHPHIARCIKSLTVRPNNEEWAQSAPQSSMREIESWVVVTIDQMAIHLVNLRTFIWDAKEFPKYDLVWQSLRASCPDLRHVGVTVGLGDFTFRSRKVMPTNSALFQFNDLLGFTLRVKQLVGSGLHPPFDELPQTLWDMLLNRCPNLQHLTIDTVNERYIDVRPLFQGRWPSLRHLTLGDFVLLDAFATVTVDPLQTSNGISNFLAYHQNLEHVALHQLEGWYFPLSLSLPPTALPNLKHFSSRFLMIRHVPNVLRLESLELMNHPHGMYRMAGALWAISQLPALSSLRIWIDCHDSGDADVKSEHVKYFADILVSAPGLRDLDISCSSDPTFSLPELSAALNTPHRLRSLAITQVKKASREGDMLKDATVLFRENATLKYLRLQDAVARWRQPRDLRLQKVATFEVIASPPVLAVQEVGLGRRGQRSCRVYRHVLKR
ncbi:hypothetical protein B0H17DRAFT_1192032 [Mycena rosella]|uniref:F-box domain-containing protein n=1 Tax=Mycena rosella TaxID=1033263 RepID=A0AAD7MA46_MYCRO|nr:hypothetical protein B0H17DRAFT_1192032 [Mycena rosella]